MIKHELEIRIQNNKRFKSVLIIVILQKGRGFVISTKEAFIDAKEVSQILGVGMTKAYAVIKAYNAELDAQGYYTMRGKCPRKYFEQKIYGYADYYNSDDDLTRKAGIVAEKCRCQAEEKVQSG
jgi:hypothetical protein